MNERLKELAEQAGFIGGIHNLKGHRVFYWDDDITEQIERFAELIRADERENIKREQQACYVKRGEK